MKALRSPSSPLRRIVRGRPERFLLFPHESHDGTCCKVNPRKVKGHRPRLGLQKVDDWIMARRPASYWASPGGPFPSLLLVAPLVMSYESGVLWLEGTARRCAENRC